MRPFVARSGIAPLVVLLLAVFSAPAAAAPEGTLTWGRIGPRVEEACVDWIKGFSYSAPYEDLKVRAR